MKLLLHAKEKAFSIASHMQSAHLIVIQTFLCKPKSSLHVSKQFFKYKRKLTKLFWMNSNGIDIFLKLRNCHIWLDFCMLMMVKNGVHLSKGTLVNTRDRIIFHLLRFSIGIHLEILAVADLLLKKLGNSHEVFNSNAEPWTERQMVKISLSLEKWWYRLQHT